MSERRGLSEPRAFQSVFNFPSNQYPASLQDSFDSLLDEFDRLRQQGDQISISDLLDRRLVGQLSKTKLKTQVFQSLVKYLIEIDLCYCFNASSLTKRMKSWDAQNYSSFGPWAVDHARIQRAGLLESLNRRRGDQNSDPLKLEGDFIFKPTFAGGRFTVHECLGTGGMGTVFRVSEKETQNEYALKTIKNRCPSLLYRLKQEFRSLIEIESHPNVILPHELFVDGADAAFTMELVKGINFFTAFENAGFKKPSLQFEQISLVRQLAKGLHHVHQHRWIHRDLKPSNVMVMKDHQVVLLDFGLVDDWALRNYQQDPSSNNGLMGTIDYLSPEQADGDNLTPASDWFSFGVLLYQCLTGNLPHAADSIDEIINRKRSGLLKKQQAFKPSSANEASLFQLAVECLNPLPENRPSYKRIESVLVNALESRSGSQPVCGEINSDRPAEISKTQNHLFVGRAAEIECFEQFTRDRLGPTLIEVVGGSGIGKTGFLNQVLAKNISSWTFRSRCFYQEKTRFPGLDPIVDQIAAMLCRLPKEETGSLLPPDSGPLLSLFPTLAQIDTLQLRRSFFDLESANLDHSNEKAGADFVDFIEQLATRQSICLVIDDFQWATQGAVGLVSKLVNDCKESAFLTIVLAYRPPKSKTDAPKLIDVPESRRKLISLPKFSTDDGIALLNAVEPKLPNRISHSTAKRDGLAKHLVSQASGSPLHLWEFVYQLNRSDTALSIEDFNYRELLRRRLTRLAPEHFALLKVVSASEFPFRLDLAAQAISKDSHANSIVKSLQQLEAQKLLTRGSDSGELEVYHSQISQCVRELAGEETMTDLHRVIAELAELQSPENYRLISEQYLACGLRQNAAQTLVLAAEAAKLRQCFEEAIYLLRESISIASLDQACSELVVDAKIKLAETLGNAGRCKQAAALFLELAEIRPRLPQETELRRNAIFQHIFADQTNIDLKTTNRIAQPLGIKFSGNPVVAMLNVMFYRMAYSLMVWRGKDSPRRFRQRELIGTVARALTLTNPLLASSLAAKLVFLCKKHGTIDEIENALDLESFLFKAVDTGKPFNLFGLKVVEKHLNKRSSSVESHHRTAALLSKSVAAYTNEDLIGSLKFNEQALAVYRQDINQFNWELEILAAFRIWAYHYTGDFNSFGKILNSRAGLLSVEKENGSTKPVPRQVLQRLPGYFETFVAKALLQDDVATAEAAIIEVDDLILGKGYSGRQHEFAFAKHYYLMYVGKVEEALANVLYQKKMIWKIGYQLIPVITPQLLTYEVVARTALAIKNPSTLKKHRSVLKKISKRLRRRQSGVRRGLVASIAAFEASCEADNDRFEAHIEDAIKGFEESGFFSLSYLLRFAAGKHEQTRKQMKWKRHAIAWAQERDIKDLSTVSRIAAPTFIN